MSDGTDPLSGRFPWQNSRHSALLFRPSDRANARAFQKGRKPRKLGRTLPVPNQSPESRFDKILIYEPYHQSITIDDTWTTETIDFTEGMFWLVNLTDTGVLPPTNENDLRTLDQWASAFGSAGLVNPSINSLQLGIGSGNPEVDAYVDYLDFSSASGSMSWDFGIPEPSATLQFLIGGTLLSLLRRRK